MARIDEIKEAFEKAKADQTEYSRNPNSPAAKRTARRAGAAMFGIGLVGGGIGYFLWQHQGRFSILVTAATLTFLGLGLYLFAFGKVPTKKR